MAMGYDYENDINELDSRMWDSEDDNWPII
jgi:hypothetical protein